ncbi:MAG: hypothetical protein RLZZ455_200 [Candidatus Parcubacteria bacterium]
MAPLSCEESIDERSMRANMKKEQFLKQTYPLGIVAIVHHTYTWSSVVEEDLLRYVSDKAVKVFYVTHPFKGARDKVPRFSTVKIYRQRKYCLNKKGWSVFGPEIFYYLRDMIFTLYYFFLRTEKIDTYVGVDNLNAFSGLILKFCGRVKRVIYYSIDYYPVRFKNPLLNQAYFFLDSFCVEHADETWNLASAMKTARMQKQGKKESMPTRQYTVPVCVWTKRFPFRPLNEIDDKKIVFSGLLSAHMGVDLLIRAMPLILKKIPDTKMIIIGGGEDQQILREMINEAQLQGKISMIPWMKERAEFLEYLSGCAVGLAPFNTRILDDKVKNADPGKIKDYMLAGLPVIVTKALSYHSDVEAKRAGIIIEYDERSFADAVISLLSDKRRLQEYRKNARQFVEKYDCEKIYSQQFSRLKLL